MKGSSEKFSAKNKQPRFSHVKVFLPSKSPRIWVRKSRIIGVCGPVGKSSPSVKQCVVGLACVPSCYYSLPLSEKQTSGTIKRIKSARCISVWCWSCKLFFVVNRWSHDAANSTSFEMTRAGFQARSISCVTLGWQLPFTFLPCKVEMIINTCLPLKADISSKWLAEGGKQLNVAPNAFSIVNKC